MDVSVLTHCYLVQMNAKARVKVSLGYLRPTKKEKANCWPKENLTRKKLASF